jgi:putative hydrolase of the HAD superfamily
MSGDDCQEPSTRPACAKCGVEQGARMALRGLIFDFDGLIVDTETATLDAWQAVHREDGLEGDPAVLHQVVGHVGIDADLWVAYPADRDRDQLEARFALATRAACLAAPVLPGVVDLLDEAAAAGLRLAVASNSSHRHVEGHLAARGLLGRFAVVSCREDVPRPKPAPDVYLAALARLGLEAGQVVAFEDSLPGHAAAAAAGLRVIVVPNPCTAGDHFHRATWRAGSLTEVTLGKLEQLLLPQGLAAGGVQGAVFQ